VITSWPAKWRGRLLAALLVPEILYDVFLQAVFVNSLFSIVTNRRRRWGNVVHQAAAAGP
jgi:biofilm PGA synthesis N-glycosyltransferase PgaC